MGIMRHLATLQKVLEVTPIEGADKIECLSIKGWKVVAKKGEFKVGDLIVYCEVDSVLPECPEFEFLRKASFRIKTIRLKGQVSQGIVFPLSVLPVLSFEHHSEGLDVEVTASYGEGQDVTDLLGIIKYEPYVPAQLAGLTKGNFPEFLRKTDEERVQNITELLEKYKGLEMYMTEKVDGSSMTVYLNNGEFGVCSRNLDLKETEDNTFWKTARALRIEQALRGCGNYAIQGELIGMGVQGNKYNMGGVEFRVFNVYDIDAHKYLDFEDFKRFVASVRLETVPMLGTTILNHTTDQILELAKGYSVLNKNALREGVVFRPLVEMHDSFLGRLSFKGINSDFLLQHGD